MGIDSRGSLKRDSKARVCGGAHTRATSRHFAASPPLFFRNRLLPAAMILVVALAMAPAMATSASAATSYPPHMVN
jgi:hypothetical protein